MNLKVGQRVTFLHESGEGTILKILSVGKFLIDDDGFERICLKSEIVPIHSKDYHIDESLIAGINADESFSTAKKATRISRGKKGEDVWEIDLHIETLTPTHSGWSNHEIVQKQLKELRSFYQRARAKRIRKLHIIHGVGTGVLKEEVRAFLQGQEGVLEFYDANYQEFGKGATTVELRYSI
jgi:hypothetical protein